LEQENLRSFDNETLTWVKEKTLRILEEKDIYYSDRKNMYVNIDIWVFPKIVVPPNHPF